MRANGSFSVSKWDEKPVDEKSAGMKITRASVEYAVTGEMEGTAHVEYLMCYTHVDPSDQHKSTASYIGLFRFDGKVANKNGSMVFEDRGTFEGGAAKSTLNMIEGSGTGAFAGFKGKGRYEAGAHGATIEFEIDAM